MGLASEPRSALVERAGRREQQPEPQRSRPEKIGVLARSPVALRGLRVCWMQRNAYNCGKCEKCVRTMLGLVVHGVLDQATGFPSRLDPDEVARVFVPEFIRIRWKEISGELQATEPDLARAAARAVARSERLDAVWHVLSRLGLTRERAKALDRAVFRGAALTVWRRLTRAR